MRYLLAIVTSCFLGSCFASATSETQRSAPVADTVVPAGMKAIKSLTILIMEFEETQGSLPKNKDELIEFKPMLTEFNIENFQTLEIRDSEDYRFVIYVETKPDDFVYKGTINYNTKADFTTDLKLFGK